MQRAMVWLTFITNIGTKDDTKQEYITRTEHQAHKVPVT